MKNEVKRELVAMVNDYVKAIDELMQKHVKIRDRVNDLQFFVGDCGEIEYGDAQFIEECMNKLSDAIAHNDYTLMSCKAHDLISCTRGRFNDLRKEIAKRESKIRDTKKEFDDILAEIEPKTAIKAITMEELEKLCEETKEEG